jgi:hypothetical protein
MHNKKHSPCFMSVTFRADLCILSHKSASRTSSSSSETRAFDAMASTSSFSSNRLSAALFLDSISSRNFIFSLVTICAVLLSSYDNGGNFATIDRRSPSLSVALLFLRPLRISIHAPHSQSLSGTMDNQAMEDK